jgi:conjugative relaxase-like TrwC/TraI family protein
MLSTKVFSSSDSASKYYSHGDYYGSEAQGNWFGLGAESLNVSGEFNAKTDQAFSNILNGILPNGQTLGRKTKDGLEHCPGVDLTFSAPKSFSIQMLVFASSEERSAMEGALTKAVNSTLKYIEEKGYAVARKGKDGQVREQINKLTFATFLHTTNRNLEPQAHVHCFLANVAKCSDGKFRSLDFKDIINNNKFFGQVFRNELALETKKLGYDITPTILSDGSSGFELNKIDSKLIDAFSTRRKEIEALCKLYDVKTKEGRDNIVINSRKSKRLASQDELSSAWKTLEQKTSNEITNQNVNNQQQNNDNLFKQAWGFLISKLNSKLSAPYKELTLEELAILCVEDATHKTSVVSWEDLLKKALKFSVGNYTVSDLEREFKTLEAQGSIIGNNGLYTTKALVTQEKQILKYAEGAIGASKEIVNEEYLSAHMEKYERMQSFKLNEQQKNTIGHILTSKDKIITVEGLPGVGKSTVLDSVRQISTKQVINLNFEGLAPTASASKTLKDSANLNASTTLHHFLGKYQGYIEGRGTAQSLNEQRKNFKNTIIFVDEASMIPTQVMHRLLILQKKFDFRLILTGDTKQLGAVEAGKPFAQILQTIKPAIMNQIVRQTGELHKQAVIAASKGDIIKSFAIHQENIQEQKSLRTLAKQAAELYLQKDQTQREQTLLIAPTRSLRDQINNNIKNMLCSKQEKLEFSALRQKDMSLADYQFASSYKENDDILKFNRAYARLGIKKGEYLKVIKINNAGNRLILKNSANKEIFFSLIKGVNYQDKFEVYNQLNLILQKDLKIIFTKNNRELGLINSETTIIKALNQNNAILQFENKLTREISLNQLKHIDYGYCVTIHNSQSKTYENTIAAISKNKLLNNQQSWLVSLSRHKTELTILSEDTKMLQTYLAKNTGIEMSALELVSKVNLHGHKSTSLKSLPVTNKNKEISI